MPRLCLLLLAAVPAAAFAEPVVAPVAASAPAAPVEYSRASLVERTPFSAGKPGKVVASGPLELRGFFGAGANTDVSLMRPDTKESAWVRLGDKSAKWVVEAADPVAGTADVRFDGLLLHLKLARPESPELTVKAGPPRGKSGGGSGWGSISPASREIMKAARKEAFETLRREHPEYFNGTKLTEAQQQERAAVMEAGFAKTRAEIAKVAPEDLPAVDEMFGKMKEWVSRSPAPRPEARAKEPAAKESDAKEAGAEPAAPGTIR